MRWCTHTHKHHLLHSHHFPPSPFSSPSALRCVFLALHANNLLQTSHHLDEVGLCVDHLRNGLVRHGCLVEHILVLPALDALCGRHVLLDRERAPRLHTRHLASGAVRARAKALAVALAAHDVAVGAHAARDDAQLPLRRTHGALARDVHVLAEVVLLLHVVVVAVDGAADRLKGWDALCAAECVEHGLHHELAVLLRVLLRPADGFDVVVEVVAAFADVGEVLVGEVAEVLAHVLLRKLDEREADCVAHAARPRVQHKPHLVVLVEVHLQEVVARPQRPQVVVVVRERQPRVPRRQPVEAGLQVLLPHLLHTVRRRAPPPARVEAPLPVVRAAVRDEHLDVRAQLAQRVGEVVRGQRRLRGDHAAADVDADGAGDDRADGRDDRAHRGRLAVVHVRHDGNVLVDDRQLGAGAQLRQRLVVDGDAVDPRLDVHLALLAAQAAPARLPDVRDVDLHGRPPGLCCGGREPEGAAAQHCGLGGGGGANEVQIL
eukprot:Rhum_TRINITY_DN3760_c0_g1::Rhum_TRINITY_DN3760_c0_g1_i1::g.11956::m.11956